MKAKQYFEQYDQAVWEEANGKTIRTDGSIAKLFLAFAAEAKELVIRRRAKTDDAVFAIIVEQNQKWNAVAGLFEKKYGVSPIKRNGFEDGMKEQLGI